MNKAVMISMQPKWCELIASGKKTIEVRKTRQQIETPFKCYIYETKGLCDTPTFVDEDGHISYRGRGAVIGEFVCDKVENIMVDIDENDHVDYLVTNDFLSNTCLSFNEICRYLRNGDGYGWHISELKIYDKPKELWEYSYPCTGKKCSKCQYEVRDELPFGTVGVCCGRYHITRPPQSWMYVGEV